MTLKYVYSWPLEVSKVFLKEQVTGDNVFSLKFTFEFQHVLKFLLRWQQEKNFKVPWLYLTSILR